MQQKTRTRGLDTLKGGTVHQGVARRRRGFTLAELLVSLFILSLGLVALGQLYVASMWTYNKARYMSLATKRAEFEMEKTRNLGVLRLLNGPAEDTYTSSEYQYDADGHGVKFTMTNIPGGKGEVRWEPYPPNTKNNTYLLKITVLITWTGVRDANSQVFLSSLLTNTE